MNKSRLRATLIAAAVLGLLCALSVTASAATVKLSRYAAVLRVGSDGPAATMALSATVKPAGKAITWRSSKPSVATVDASGLVTPVKPGTAYIRATAGGVSRRCVVTVKGVVPTGLTLDTAKAHVAPKGKIALTPGIQPANAYNKAVAWSSSNTAVARVSSAGVVTGVRLGSAVIACKTKSGGLVAKATVSVDYADSAVRYLAVGQEAYRTSRLNGAVDDAKAFIATLEACDFGQAGDISGSLLTDLTAAQLRAALSGAAVGRTENDVTYIYYSGHGMSGSSLSDRGALVGVDMNLVRVDEVKALLSQIPGTVVVMLDCCLSGQYITAKSAASAQNRDAFLSGVVEAFASQGEVQAKGITTLAGNDKFVVAVACKPLQSSYMADGESFFTKVICLAGGREQGMTLGTLPGDANGNGRVTLRELYRFAYPRLNALAASYEVKQNMMIWPTDSIFPIFAR